MAASWRVYKAVVGKGLTGEIYLKKTQFNPKFWGRKHLPSRNSNNRNRRVYASV